MGTLAQARRPARTGGFGLTVKVIAALAFAALMVLGLAGLGFEQYTAQKHAASMAGQLATTQAVAAQAQADAAAAVSEAKAVEAAYAARAATQATAAATAKAAHASLASAAKTSPVASEIVPADMWAAIEGVTRASH